MAGRTVLPSGEELQVTPEEILRYINPDGLRQLLRQERLRWNLKTNKDVDYYDNTRLSKHSGEAHNEGLYQRLEIRTFPDNGANAGYTGINNDSGLFGLPHNVELWDKSISEESLKEIVNRTTIGSLAKIPGKSGYGLDDNDKMTTDTDNRIALILFDPGDGRAYLLSNDDPNYVNNETRSVDQRIPERAVARIGDIPTRMTQLENDFDMVADPDYVHTDNNFTNSNRFILDNIDDRTFVYPEIARDKNGGDFIENYRVGLNGEPDYDECDGLLTPNSQPDLGVNPDLGKYGDRFGEAISSYNKNINFSGVNHRKGYLPGIFRSLEELERVDLIDQTMTPRTHQDTPGAKRPNNYYIFDGKWSPNWFDRIMYNDSYLAQSLNPSNMELNVPDVEPTPFGKLDQTEDKFNMGKLYQWRYNRVTLKYLSKDITCSIVESGEQYRVGDILRWSFADDSFVFEVTMVGANGQIQRGEFKPEANRVYEQDPSTHGVGVPFANTSGVGHGAKIAINSKVTIESHASQIKNNLYAYVDITPTVRSDNSLPWSDTKPSDDQDGKIVVRSTAAGPAYSGINSGRGGPAPDELTSDTVFYEHGGNATAGVHVHLFRYVIDTENPTWVIRNGIQVFTGRWVDQGPMGIERPCDIKALLFSNPDTNNFNNYYKFLMDTMFDTMNRNPDTVITNDKNSITNAYIHYDQEDPEPDQKFYQWKINPETSQVSKVDITEKVLYINLATGITFVYNQSFKNDPKYGYGMRAPGWVAIAGAVSK